MSPPPREFAAKRLGPAGLRQSLGQVRDAAFTVPNPLLPVVRLWLLSQACRDALPKDRSEALDEREIASAVAQCHAWLNNNARPPKVVDDVPPEQRSIALEKWRADPHLLVSMGAAADEDPESRAGLVRTLLAELVVAKQVDELPGPRRAALASRTTRGSPF